MRFSPLRRILLTINKYIMKTLTCDLCDYVAQGETFEEWMNALKPHYVKTHADVMQSKKGTPEEMKAQMMEWMAENKKRFDEAK